MSDFIPLCEPCLQGNEWRYVKECLDSTWISSAGKFVSLFEKNICQFTGATYAVACVNGTAALQVALRVVGVEAGDEVLVSTLTFIAPVNAIQYLHATPVFMDCDEFYCLDSDKTIDFIRTQTVFRDGFTYNKSSNRRISAIVPVHIFGNAANLDLLVTLCRERNIKMVEDSTESLGTFYTSGSFKGRYTGTIGDIGCFSFNGNKIMTTGGGGMIVTDNPDYAQKALYLTTQAKNDTVRYIHDEVGYNFRLTNLQAAIGVAQLEQLPSFIQAKRSIYQFYKNHFSAKIADVPSYAENNCWMVALQLDNLNQREQFMESLTMKKIQTRPVWYLNHLQKPYINCQSYSIENALNLWERTLNLPCSVDLSQESLKRVVESLDV